MPIQYGQQTHVEKTSNQYRLPKAEKRARPLFHLMVHPDRWYWDDKAQEWLPELGRMVISAGVGGVRLTPNGHEDDSMARAGLMKKGWILLENGDARFDSIIPGGKYIAEFPALPRGNAYAPIWEGYELVRGVPVWGENHDVKVAFLRRILELGIIPPMPEALREYELKARRRSLARLQARADANPNLSDVAARVAKAKALYERMAGLTGSQTVEPVEPVDEKPKAAPKAAPKKTGAAK